jgi:hypothetical protein
MKKSFEEALTEQGYITIVAIGFKESGHDYRIKVAASPVLKALQPETYDMLMETIIGALSKLYDTPMDDLEIQ